DLPARAGPRRDPDAAADGGADGGPADALAGGGRAQQQPAMMAVLGTFGAITAGWAGVFLAAIAVVPRVRDQELLVTWRLALLLPGAVPLRSLALAVLLAAWTLVCTSVWPLGLLLGAGLAIDMAVGLLSRRIALLLEDLSAR